MENLTELDGVVRIENLDLLREIDFRSLLRASAVDVEACPQLERAFFDALISTDFDVSFTRTGAPTVDLPALQQARRLVFAGTSLTAIALQSLHSVDWLSIRANAMLTRIDLPRLTSVETFIELTANPNVADANICEILESLGEEGLPSSRNVDAAECN